MKQGPKANLGQWVTMEFTRTSPFKHKLTVKKKNPIDDERLTPTVTRKPSRVPIPTKCTVRAIKGSCLLTVVQGNATDELLPGDIIRIGNPHDANDYLISSNISDKQVFLTDVFHSSENRSHEENAVNSKNHSFNSNNAFDQQQRRIWKLIPKDRDKRLEWRIRYDEGKVPWKTQYNDPSASSSHFGVQLQWAQIEYMCRGADALCLDFDSSANQQRLHYFEKVPLNEIITATYNFVCQWHPIGISIDNVKWARLARKMDFLFSLKNSKHQVDMAFFRHSRDRKLDMNQFTSVLRDMSRLRYPPSRYESLDALANMLWTTVVILPQVNDVIWSRATEMALTAEMFRTCAQTRISAFYRIVWRRRSYILMRHAVLLINKNTRRWLAVRRSRWVLGLVEYDWIYRIRHISALICQKIWRGYSCILDFAKVKQKRREEEEKELSRSWRDLRERGRIKKVTLVFRKILNIQSILTVTSMRLKEKKRINQANELEIQVYVPETGRTFRFQLGENELRECVEKTLASNGQLSWNEMLDIRVLSQLTIRLIAKVVSGSPLILFSRRGMAEKGELIVKRLLNFDESLYIVQVYRSPLDVVVRVYDSSTCEQLRTLLTMPRLIEWLIEDEEERKKDALRAMNFRRLCRKLVRKDLIDDKFIQQPDCLMGFSDKNNFEVPELLKRHKQPELIHWLLKRIHVERDDKSKKLGLQLRYEADAENREKIANKIQCIWRWKKARNRAKIMTLSRYEKCFDRTVGGFFYVDIKRGTSQWSKPVLLSDEDVMLPSNEWRISYCHNPDTGETDKYFTNPFTGQTSWLSENDAALIVQKNLRQHQSSELLGSKLDFSQIVKAVTLIKDTEVKYEISPDKLPNMVNFALLCHCIRLDFEKARPLYKDTFTKSPCHPVIARAYGIFNMASCDAPQIQIFQKACKLFEDSDASDPQQSLFQSAKANFFHFAVLIHPNNSIALLNYALLHQCVLKEYNRAEMIYRRALALNPDNSYVVRNFNLFEEQRYPGGFYADKSVPFSIIERSHIVEERPEWKQWKKMKDPVSKKEAFCYFWFNRVKKMSSFYEPE